jgi:hypothetical protein
LVEYLSARIKGSVKVMAAVMNEVKFDGLLLKAYDADTAENVAEVLAIVDQHEGIVHKADASGSRLLHYASDGGRVDLMRGLIDRGAEVSAKDSDGRDALMLAALNGHIPAASLLLDRGADVNAKANSGQNALMYAAEADNLDCAVFLLTRGFDLDATDNGGQTALDYYGKYAYTPTSEVKEQRREVLRAAFAEGPHPSQVKRRNWNKRRALILVAAENGFRPLAARRLEQELARVSLDPANEAEVPAVVLDTPEKRHAHYMGQVFSNDGLLRLVVSFL